MADEPQKPAPLLPMDEGDPAKWKPGKRTGTALAALIAATVAATAQFTTHFEGEKHKVYLDPVGIPTYCIGETKNPDPTRIYSSGECNALLRARMARDFGPQLVACVPNLADPAHNFPFRALLDASYNAGPAAACRSPMARAFNAGRWVEGCKAFPNWFVTARGVKLRGLVRRREAERDFCLTGKQP